jgi:hypothetical protein
MGGTLLFERTIGVVLFLVVIPWLGKRWINRS